MPEKQLNPDRKIARTRMIDIAREAGVSRPLVSHVLNGGKGTVRVSPKTAEKIREIARKHNFHANHAARQLAGKRSNLIVALANNWYFFPIRARLESFLLRMADNRGLKVLPFQTDDTPSKVATFLNDWSGRGIDGLIYLAFENDAEWPGVVPLLSQLPHVVSIIDDPHIQGGSAVVTDPAAGVRLAVEHFHSRGRKRIVHVINTRTTNFNRLRVEGAVAAHRDLGLPCNIDDICLRIEGDWDEPSNPRHAALYEELVSVRKADAIVADDDFCAAIILRGMSALGVRVPDDVAVIGWGNEVVARFVVPRLTTIDYRVPEILSAALDLLAAAIEGNATCGPAVVTIQPKLIVRESA